MSRVRYHLILLALVCLAAGCVESSREEATGKAALIGVNAIVDAPDVRFKIEERSLGTVAYGEASQVRRFDDLSYKFNFDASIPGEDGERRLASRVLDVTRDTAYLFALDGSVGNAEIVLWEHEERQWQDGDTVFELYFAHLNDTAGRVDVYFAEPGVAPAAGAAAATIARGERAGPAEFAAGDYVLTVTRADEPQTILFTSLTRSYVAATTDTILLLDPDPSRTADLSVRQVVAAGTSLQLGDPRIPPRGRVLHAAPGIGNVDVAENGDFANLVASDLAPGELSAEAPLTAGTNTYTFTDAGNQGAPIVESEQVIGTGFFETLILTGPASDPAVLNTVSQRRPFATSGRLGFVHAAAAFPLVDIYLLEAGTPIDDELPLSAFVPYGVGTGLVPVAAEDYEVTVTVAGEKTVLAGPAAIDVANGDVIELFVVETPDPNAADLEIVRYAP